jgi:hypothetical protein
MKKKKYYVPEDFMTSKDDPVEVAAAIKMGVLSQMHILKGVSDADVDKLHGLLLSCKSEWEMQTMLHDVIRFNETVEELLARKSK